MERMLGPLAGDHLLYAVAADGGGRVFNDGEVIQTNDGATALQAMLVTHPAAQVLVELARGVDEAVGDGTTTSVVLAGSLMHQAIGLLDAGVRCSCCYVIPVVEAEY